MQFNISTYLNDFIELFFPRICLVCGNNLLNREELVCLQCLHELPRTNFHLQERNPVAEIFYGRVQLEAATSFFFFNKGSQYQKLIHALKYKGMKEIGILLGKHFAIDLAKSSSFASVDIICPVPLHPKKEKKRGYNQSEFIALGIAERMEKPLSTDNLARLIYTDSQTRKGRYERWENVEGIFGLNRPDEFEGKHILLIDDVLTTGSTLEACASAILSVTRNTKVSIATLGFA
ncbi:MAG: amidophosphoribosyltransferase [Bacteroidetes bacterium GWF2_42_66]|nr:MAG: amidophosphoribosyltransferase [Bacteroidetes bacterium GWA2_42_15]OFX98443.1 MAG: amidophosphoribosyltransferase [Bacteroidetes bacterium GWE2_42_39]OFY42828.1 MAG: amidophosphoribosyltransferase [Bacteroidetes bacterium GWF2_42_66]HBL74453.1 amidophosphoribosyltransferase [Prolixibacteraceae bacterium]HCR89119.1 amidophosphoribosyltransferase [Prolixibacteraceae bacterium]